MKREKVTYEEVVTACEALVGRGDSPSVRSVLQEVGGGGSQTIATHLTLWRQSRAANDEARNAITSQHISHDLIQSLLREIERHKEQAVQSVKQQLVTSEDDVAALRDALDKAHADIDERGRRADDAERDLTSARQQMSTEAATRAALLGESEKQFDKLHRELETFRQQFDVLADELAKERIVTAQLRAAVGTHETRAHELTLAARQAGEMVEHVRAEHKNTQQGLAEMQFAVFEAEKKAAVAAEQVNSRDASLARLEAMCASLQEQQRALEAKHQNIAEKCEAATRRADIAEARLVAVSETRAALPQALEATDEVSNSPN